MNYSNAVLSLKSPNAREEFFFKLSWLFYTKVTCPTLFLHSASCSRILLCLDTKIRNKIIMHPSFHKEYKWRAVVCSTVFIISSCFASLLEVKKVRLKHELCSSKNSTAILHSKALSETGREQLSKTVFITCCLTKQPFDIVIFCVPQNSTSASFSL